MKGSPSLPQRLAVLFQTFSYLTTQQIARGLGISIPHARVLLSEARQYGQVRTQHTSRTTARRIHRVTPLEVPAC